MSASRWLLPPARPVPDARDSTTRFILLYALAWAGGTIAYVPLLTILLPARIAALAGTQAGVDWLAYIAFAGAIAASLGGIAFGYLSDLTRNRRGWIATGLLACCAMLAVIAWADSLPLLIGAIIAWQLALNMMLAPLAAWAGDVVPDDRKGLLGGLMAFAPGLGALSGAIITHPGLAGPDARLGLVALFVVLCVGPLLLRRDASQNPAPSVSPERAVGSSPARVPVEVLYMWMARLAVQIAEATLFAYLFFWLVRIDAGVSDNETAQLFSLILLISAPLALIAGRLSDRAGRPILPLRLCALGSALGLAAMALADTLAAAKLAYALFGIASAIFLALHSAQTLRILPRPDRRGRDLGLFNLANTIPSMVMPWLAVALVPRLGYPALFALLAVLALFAAALLQRVAPTR